MGFALVVVTFIAYWPALSGGFVWDDDAWTTGITALLRDVSGLCSMWCRPTALQQYYPLTGTTFWLDYNLWGFWTPPYHIENVLLHALSAVLFWQLLRRLKLPAAWLAGAIFALHPMMVESAGWITERKNVLSLPLYLGALLAYGRFNGFREEDDCLQPRRWGAYSLALILFSGALFAKTTAFSLPATILLIGWWKHGRIRRREDVLWTLPLFTLAIAFSFVTARLERIHVGAQGPGFALSVGERCLIAGRVPWSYIGNLVWPTKLSFTYPLWRLDTRSWESWLYPVATCGTLAALWFARRHIGRGPVTAAFFFVGTLFPVLGFLNVYGMRYSFVWDHWAYLPSLGLIALAAALASRVADNLRAPALLCGAAAIVLVALAALTWSRAHAYEDLETLWRDTVKRNPSGWLGQNNLGILLWQAGKTQEGAEYLEQALRIDSGFAETHYNLGLVREKEGKLEDAMKFYEQAIQLQPHYPDAHYNLGVALQRSGRLEEAIAHYQVAILYNPNFAIGHSNLGVALWQSGRVQEAIEHLERAIQLKPDYAEAYGNLGVALWQTGRADDATRRLEQAVRLKPDYVDAQYNLGIIMEQSGLTAKAIEHYQQALRVQPNLSDARNRLARLAVRQ